MSHQCILVIGMDPERESQLQQEWYRSHLKVPLVVRRTGQGAFNYLNAIRQNSEFGFPRPVMLVIDWCLADMPAFLVVRQLRREPRFRELLIIACHKQWELLDERLAYTMGVDTCVECPETFANLLDRVHRIEEYWFSESDSPVNPASALK